MTLNLDFKTIQYIYIDINQKYTEELEKEYNDEKNKDKTDGSVSITEEMKGRFDVYRKILDSLKTLKEIT